MNETEVKQVKADRQALEKEEIPETFAVEASTLEPIKTGMGPDMDKLAEQSGFAAKAYRMPAGIKRQLRCVLALSVRIRLQVWI